MKAVVFGPDERPQVCDVPEPTPGPHDVVIEVEYCGICGSDLHASARLSRIGVTMGHEFAGTIVELGRSVDGWRIGDQVSANPNGEWCGTCSSCRRGLHNLCPHLWANVVGLNRDGAMAPLVSVAARTLYRLPDSVSGRQGAWVEPLAVALRAVRRSGIRLGEPAVVFGAGPIGLLVTQLLVSACASRVTVIEPNPARRSLAHDCGAAAALDPLTTDVPQHFADPARAPQFAFDCAGVPEVTRTAVEILAAQGRLTVAGLARREPSYNATRLLFKEIEIRGSFIYDEEFPKAIELLATGVVEVDALTSGVLDVTDGPAAFAQMLGSESVVKLLLQPTR